MIMKKEDQRAKEDIDKGKEEGCVSLSDLSCIIRSQRPKADG